MPCRILRVPAEMDVDALLSWLSGRKNPGNDVTARVRDILADVQQRGDTALRDYTRRFDAPNLPSRFRVPPRHCGGPQSVAASDLDILREAIARVRDFHARQAEQSWFTTSADGTVLGQMVRPWTAWACTCPAAREAKPRSFRA
jgi:histidinol dehydrogenase